MPTSRQDLRRALQAVAFQQAGYFTAGQALAAGYSYQAQKYHADSGNWTRIDRALFRLPDWPVESEDIYVRWTLWARGQAVVSHESALVVHQLSDVDPAHVHLTVPEGFPASNEQVRLHFAHLDEVQTEARRGWSVTTPTRTLLDVADSSVSQEQVDRAVGDALRDGKATRRQLLRASADATDRAALKIERAIARSQDGD